MIDNLITGLMLVVAAIHLVPITGFFGAKRLSALYGIEVDSPDLEILMRHRAVLFGILGAFFAYAAFVPALQPIAFVAAATSLATFFYLAVAV
ncbi:MAG: phosphopantetheine adenylyltransferase, partial [Myxococcales bacterium]